MQTMQRVFISFHYEDLHYANLMDAWCANDNNDFAMYNERVKVAVNSRDADYIKTKISPKIQRSSVLLCLIGSGTSGSGWVNWEIDAAKGMGKGLVGVQLASGNRRPASINNAGAVFVLYLQAEILKAIRWAATAGKSAGDFSYQK